MPTCFRSGRRYGAVPCPGFTVMWHVRVGNGYFTAFGCDARGLRMQVLRRVYMSRRVGANGCFPSPVIGAVVVATSFFRSGSRPRRSPAWTPRAGSSWLGAWEKSHSATDTDSLQRSLTTSLCFLKIHCKGMLKTCWFWHTQSWLWRSPWVAATSCCIMTEDPKASFTCDRQQYKDIWHPVIVGPAK